MEPRGVEWQAIPSADSRCYRRFIMGQAVSLSSPRLLPVSRRLSLARTIQFHRSRGRADGREIFFSSGTAARHEFHRVWWFPSLSSGRAFSPLETHCSSPCWRPRFRKRSGIPLCLPRRRKIVFHRRDIYRRWIVLSNPRNACFFIDPSFSPSTRHQQSTRLIFQPRESTRAGFARIFR